MFDSLEPNQELATDRKPLVYSASVYGLFCLLGALSAVLAVFSRHRSGHLFVAACYLAECVLAFWFLVEGFNQGPPTQLTLSRRARLLLVLVLLPNLVYSFL